jgi:hypothetical protein
MTDNIELYGNAGLYVADGNAISFQLGEGEQLFAPAAIGAPEGAELPYNEKVWLGVKGYQVCARGRNNALCEDVAREIKRNRILPRLYRKQAKMLYGHGPMPYRNVMHEGKLRREYVEEPEVQAWFNSWQSKGMPSVQEFCKACIINYYYFGDFFVKWRMARGHRLGLMPVAGLEVMENTQCRLATTQQDLAQELITYADLRHVAVGRWAYGIGSYRIYPRFNLSEVDNYQFAAVSHHRETSIDEFYGTNETHQGSRPYIQGSNKTPVYINSFLRNSLAAKVHIIIPNAWVESKRNQMQRLCEENKTRKAKKLDLIRYNGLDIGTEMRESLLVQYIREELRKFGAYLSGEGNQGKAYSSFSFSDAQGHEQQWKIETVDLKYKEYIEALIAYDKRAEQALLASVGLDASISAIDKEGVISKSGSDAYYNYLIYIMGLTSEDEICCEPLNWALQVNFPKLYAGGLRMGFYREVPQRQEDVAPKDRLNNQQS